MDFPLFESSFHSPSQLYELDLPSIGTSLAKLVWGWPRSQPPSTDPKVGLASFQVGPAPVPASKKGIESYWWMAQPALCLAQVVILRWPM